MVSDLNDKKIVRTWIIVLVLIAIFGLILFTVFGTGKMSESITGNVKIVEKEDITTIEDAKKSRNSYAYKLDKDGLFYIEMFKTKMDSDEYISEGTFEISKENYDKLNKGEYYYFKLIMNEKTKEGKVKEVYNENPVQ
ncbi:MULTISPECIES: hypothetical protein [Clostridium]|uniref:Uncharacterized protein n=1 Tax=Clostridium senegalense TaxID=1465809 RepID=A0A6M0H9I9_9CLOT|nr:MULTISPECIES: hypothetical protein [Clostridium]NEU06302.1 hypothetical protein [Clostridium senegalense]